MPPTAQQARFQELASKEGHDAVTAHPLPDGTLILTARNSAGKIVTVEVLDGNGGRLELADPLGAIRRLGMFRTMALEEVDKLTAAIANLLALRQAAGEELHLTELARESGLARQTLYSRVADAPLAKGAGKS